MAYTQNARSFTATASVTSSDNKSNAPALHASLGNIKHGWGTSKIWGNGDPTDGDSSGLAATVAKRDNSSARSGLHESSLDALDVAEGIFGSASLANTSTMDHWSRTPAWSAKHSFPPQQTKSQMQSRGELSIQQRAGDQAQNPFSFADYSHNASTLASRPQRANLTGATPMQQGPSFGPIWTNSFSAGRSEQPPNVYTKFNRPQDPKAQGFSVSGKGNSWKQYSPTREFDHGYNSQTTPRHSLPSSRDGSEVPLWQSENWTMPRKADYPHPPQRSNDSSSRALPHVFAKSPSYLDKDMLSLTDRLSNHFDTLSFGDWTRPSSSHRYNPTDLSTSRATAHNDQSSASGAFPGSNGQIGTTTNGDRVLDLQRSNIDGFGAARRSHDFISASNSVHVSKPSQSAAEVKDAPGYSFSGALPSDESSSGVRSHSRWQTSNELALAARNASMLPEQAMFMDPHMQRFFGSQFRNSYNSLYNPYLLTNHMGIGPDFATGMSMNGASPSNAAPPSEVYQGDGLASAMMYEFKSNTKSKKYDLRDIYGHIAEFSGDQHGSRFIQTKLETANSDEKERVFQELRPNALPLMTDVFGNYVIQKFFEHGDQMHKRTLANMMKGQVLNLSLQMYGCRVVQKALDHVLVDQQAQLIGELECNVLKCVKDQNGNHVVQKAIERCSQETIGFIIAAFHGQVQGLSIHPYGCRVIQRCLERCEPQFKAVIMHELMDGIQSMIADQYGNYVVQHIVEHDAGEARRRVLDIVGGNLEAYSKHKFASNVVEKCLEKADDGWRRDIITVLTSGDQRRCEGEPVLVGLIKDNFGNYVIQKLLDTLSPPEYDIFLDFLQPAMIQAKRTGCGKQVLSIEKKMQRFPPLRNSLNLVGGFGATSYRLPIPTPPFASYHGSAATTPPPLTADTQSLQSSGIPSINGDAVEGAGMNSRKGSEVSNGGQYLPLR